MPEQAPKPDKGTLRVECICLLREFGRKSFSLIDQILGLDPGLSRRTYEKENKAYQSWTQKYANQALQKFYSDQITILEVLSKTTPASIKLWQDILFDTGSKQADKERAAKEIREWTKLFLASKDKAGMRDLIPDHLLEAHDEAEEMGGHLSRMLGNSLDLEDVQ